MAQAMHGVVDLKRGEPLRMPTRCTVRLTALGGLVWVTQAGDLDDHFLVAGQTMLVAAGKQAPLLYLLFMRPRRSWRERWAGWSQRRRWAA